jgi:hypothetical protein
MAKSTFSGPVRSLGGFINAGSKSFVSLTADTTLTDPGQTNNIGAQFTFVVETVATDMDILTDGTDKFVGGLAFGKSDASGKTFFSGAANDVITLNGTTKGGIVGTTIIVTAMASAKYHVTGIVLASGTVVTPFADA